MLFMMTFEKLYSKNEPIFWWLTSVLNKNFFAIFLLLTIDDFEKDFTMDLDSGELVKAARDFVQRKCKVTTAIDFLEIFGNIAT